MATRLDDRTKGEVVQNAVTNESLPVNCADCKSCASHPKTTACIKYRRQFEGSKDHSKVYSARKLCAVPVNLVAVSRHCIPVPPSLCANALLVCTVRKWKWEFWENSSEDLLKLCTPCRRLALNVVCAWLSCYSVISEISINEIHLGFLSPSCM